MNKQELVKLLIDNFTDDKGNLDLTGLDFGKFDGSVNISGMIVKRNLSQGNQLVGGSLWQGCQDVLGDLYQFWQTVGGHTFQNKFKEVTK